MAIYQHVRPGVQADAARAFAGPIAFTDFHPVEGSVGQACAGGIAVTPRQQSG